MATKRCLNLRRLSECEIKKLIVLSRQGQEDSRNRLLRAHLPLVIKFARKFHRQGAFLELDDLVQQGCIGLLRAIEKFNFNCWSRGKNVKFSTYAVYWIQHHIRREIENRGRLIALPVHFQYILRSYTQATYLSKTSSFSDEKLRLLWDASQEALSLDALSSDHEQPVSRTLQFVQTQKDNPERVHGSIDINEELHKLLAAIPERERFILEQHYGLIQGIPEKSLDDLSVILKVSPERVRQLRAKALHRLRRLAAESKKNGIRPSSPQDRRT